MNIITMISAPVSGAVIGYFTNWLAIKMLFRPYDEKRVFKIRIPFTPGLIPKGRYALSEKLGKTVSENVLTTEVLNKAIMSEGIIEKISGFITTAYDGFVERDISVEMAVGYLHPEPDKLFDDMGQSAQKWLMAHIKGGEFDRLLKDMLSGLAAKLMDSASPLGGYLPSDTAAGIKGIVKRTIPNAAEYISNLSSSMPELDKSLRELVIKVASDNFGKIVGIFVNYDKLYENIKRGVADYLSDEKNQDVLCEKLEAYIEKWLDAPMNDIASKLPESFAEALPQKISGLISGFDESGGVGKFMSEIITKLINTIRHFNISKAAASLSAEHRDKLFEFINKAVLKIISTGGSYIVENLDMAAIMEEKINSFEMREAEDLIVSVVSRELRAITIFGGVLGFVIGLLPVLLEMVGG